MDAPEHIRNRFPPARQVTLIERYVTRTVRVKKGKRWVKKQVKSAVAVFIITSLDAPRKVFLPGHEGLLRPRTARSRLVSCLILRMVAAILVGVGKRARALSAPASGATTSS